MWKTVARRPWKCNDEWVVKNWSVGPQKIHRKSTHFFTHHIFHSNATPIASEVSTPISTANFDRRFVDQTWGNLRGVWPRQRHTAWTNQTSHTLNRKQRTTIPTYPTVQFPAQHPPMKICASNARTRSYPQQRPELRKINKNIHCIFTLVAFHPEKSLLGKFRRWSGAGVGVGMLRGALCAWVTLPGNPMCFTEPTRLSKAHRLPRDVNKAHNLIINTASTSPDLTKMFEAPKIIQKELASSRNH